jgi:hypothetical protein
VAIPLKSIPSKPWGVGEGGDTFDFNDSKPEEWEELGKFSLECHSQILEETRIQNVVQILDK